MDRVAGTYWLGRVAHALNRVGLGRLTRGARRVFANRPLHAEILGFQLQGSLNHRAYLAEMRAGKREEFMAELFESSAADDDVVVDVGACLGLFSLLAARRLGVGGRVFAFEPNPDTHALLVHNIARNGFAERVVAGQRAASDQSGQTTFYLDEVAASSSSLFAPDRPARAVTVEQCRLDDVLDSAEHLRLVKIDAEGAEVQVLRGMRKSLHRARPKLRVFAECHPALLERAGSSIEDLLAELDAAGLVPKLIDERNRALVPFDGDLGGETYVNLLCERGDST